MRVEALILGHGAGGTAVYSAYPSSSFVLILDGRPVLLADVGLGVVASYLRKFPGCQIPATVYISHNHSDHAGELPVLLAVESASGRRMRVMAQQDVMLRLQQHRLAELTSTSKPLDAFAEFVSCCDDPNPIHDAPGLTVRVVRSRHSELCYGAVYYANGRAVLGWTADSGACDELYSQLSEADVLLLDARHTGSAEHASFNEIVTRAGAWTKAGKRVYVTGYGTPDECLLPSGPPELNGVMPVAEGQRICLLDT